MPSLFNTGVCYSMQIYIYSLKRHLKKSQIQINALYATKTFQVYFKATSGEKIYFENKIYDSAILYKGALNPCTNKNTHGELNPYYTQKGSSVSISKLMPRIRRHFSVRVDVGVGTYHLFC